MVHVALIVVMEEEGSDDHGASAEGARATLYEIDLDSPLGERDVHRVLKNHRRPPHGRSADLPAVPPEEEDDAATVREWARRRQLPVSARGRIPEQIRRQYDKERERARRSTVAEAVEEAAVEQGECASVMQLQGCRRRRNGTTGSH